MCWQKLTGHHCSSHVSQLSSLPLYFPIQFWVTLFAQCASFPLLFHSLCTSVSLARSTTLWATFAFILFGAITFCIGAFVRAYAFYRQEKGMRNSQIQMQHAQNVLTSHNANAKSPRSTGTGETAMTDVVCAEQPSSTISSATCSASSSSYIRTSDEGKAACLRLHINLY